MQQAQLVLASDIHLLHMDDERGRLLLDLIDQLRRRARPVEFFVLNGDIFDFCYGDSPYFRAKFAPLGAALAQLAACGTRVLFIEGNHEFHMRHIGWAGVDIVTQRDYVVTLSTGERIKIAHGDLITGDRLYAAFRALIKSRLAHRLARFIPGAWLDAYALRHSKVSRAQDDYRRLDHDRVLRGFAGWLADGKFDHGVIGHFHHPYHAPRVGGPGLMLCVESWLQRPNALVYGAGAWRRLLLSPGGSTELILADAVP